MAVFLAEGQAVAEQFQAGDVGHAPMGAGHYVRNTGPTLLKVLIGFNDGPYLSNDLSTWMSTNPPDVLATNLGLPRTVVERVPRRESFMVLARAGIFSESLTRPGFWTCPGLMMRLRLIAAPVVAMVRLGEVECRVAPDGGVWMIDDAVDGVRRLLKRRNAS